MIENEMRLLQFIEDYPFTSKKTIFSAAWELSSWRSGTIKKRTNWVRVQVPLCIWIMMPVLSLLTYTVLEFISGLSPLPFSWRMTCVERFRSVLNYCGFKLSDCCLNCVVDLVFLWKLSWDEWKLKTAHSYEMASNSTFMLQIELWRTRFNSGSVLRIEVSFYYLKMKINSMIGDVTDHNHDKLYDKDWIDI